MPDRAPQLAGLAVDWGGVLTQQLEGSLAAWAEADGIDYAVFRGVMRDWMGPAVAEEAAYNPVHALERGEMELPDFERRLAAELGGRSGRPVAPDGLLRRMWRHFEHSPDMAGLVRRAHHAGIRTALLSNSWGDTYPRDGWDEMFDVVVISGEVGMRKPEPEIYAHTLELMRLGPGECVFVDDLRPNVEAAVTAGFVGVHHRTYAETAAELDLLFGVTLSA